MYKVWDFWMETGIVTGGEYSSEQVRLHYLYKIHLPLAERFDFLALENFTLKDR